MSGTSTWSDVVVVGGGVIGASVAHHLARAGGVSVTVVDVKRPGNASQASAGGLWAIGESVGLGCGVIYARTKAEAAVVQGVQGGPGGQAGRPEQMPRSFLDLALASAARFPALHAELLDLTGVDVGFERTGLTYVMFDEADRAYARAIHDSLPHLHEEMSWVDPDELAREEPHVSREAVGGLRFATDHQVNPFRLAQAYLDGALAHGARLVQDDAVGVQTAAGRVTGVVTTGGSIACGTLVNAAGAWAGELAATAGITVPVHPVKGQIVLTERLPPVLGSCLSTNDCYLAQKDNGEVLIGSTTQDVGFDTTVDLAAVASLARGATRAVPALAEVACKRTWAGLRPGSPDEMPILGPVAGLEGYVNACGHFRTGVLMSAVTGEVVDAVVRGTDPGIDLAPYLLERFGSPWHGSALPARREIARAA